MVTISSLDKHLYCLNVNLRPREDEMYLDSRCGSDGIDGVHSTGSAVVMVMDVTAVHWLEELLAAGQQWSQEEEDD